MNGITTFLNYKTEKFNLYSSLNLKNRFNIREGWNEKDVAYGYTNSTAVDTSESFHYNYTNEIFYNKYR